MITSIKILLIGIAIVFMTGDIVTFFSGLASNKAEKYYSLVFLSGYAINATLFKLIVYMNIPLKNIGRPYFLILFIIYIIFFITKKRKCYAEENFIKVNLSNIVVLFMASWNYILYGAKWYKAYGWWDIHYYSVQAEAVRSTPFHQWSVLAQTSPNMLAVTTYFQGAHRISLGAFTGLIASVANVDGASAVGFTNAFAMLLIYCAVMYYLGGRDIAFWKKALIALTATFIPGVVMTNLECFVPMLLFIGIIVFTSKLIEDILLQNSIKGSVLGGIIYAAACTTLLDGIYILIAVLIIDLLILMLKGKISLKKGIVKVITIIASTIVWNIPYLPYILEELHTDLARQALNSIYYFSYSPGLFRWIFYGSALENTSEKIVLLLTLVAIVMFILGMAGIIGEVLKRMDIFFLNGLAVICASLIFFSMKEEMQYAFYKVFSLAIPIIIVGIWMCVNDISICFQKNFIVNIKIRKILQNLVLGGTTIYLLFCVGNSMLRMGAIFPGLEKYADRLIGIYTLYSDEAKNLYSEIEKSDEENILIVCNSFNAEPGMRWAYYYGRNKNMYALSEGQLSQILNGRDSEGWDFLNIPNNVKIIYSYPNHDTVYSEQYRDTVAMTCAYRNGQYAKIHDPLEYPDEESQEYTLSVFSKEELDGEIYLQLENSEDNKGTITVDGKEYAYVNGENLVIPIKLKKENRRLYITSDTNIKITGYGINIK